MINDQELSFANYQIEVSGWGSDESFFVEKTDLLWTSGNDKKLQLRHSLPDGATLFVRLLGDTPAGGSMPLAYRVENLQPMNRIGLCEVRLLPLHPRMKTPGERGAARPESNTRDRRTDLNENLPLAELQEVLHEA